MNTLLLPTRILFILNLIELLKDFVMGLVSDHILDDIWADHVEQQYINIAGPVAFQLAFITKMAHTEDEPTIASKRNSGLFGLIRRKA